MPRATSQSARGSLPPANSGGSYLRAFVAEQRSGWGSVPKAKSHSSVRSEPAGSALTQSIGEGQKSCCGTLVKMNQSLSKLCVYIPKCLARIWRILGYPTIRKVPARGTFVPLIGD